MKSPILKIYPIFYSLLHLLLLKPIFYLKFIKILSLFIMTCITIISPTYAHIDPHSKEFERLADDEFQEEKGFIGEIFLQPAFVLSKKNRFQLFPSSLYLSLGKDYYSAHFLFSENQSFLRSFFLHQYNPSRMRYNYGMTSVFIQAKWPVYGRLRAGLIPLSYGLEGGVRDSQLVLPRSIFSQFIPNYDLGLSYLASYKGFYVESALHNGAFQGNTFSNPIASQRLWWTTKGGWKANYGIDIGMSASVGEFIGRNLWPYYSHARRVGNAFLAFQIKQMSFKSEYHFGEIYFDENKIPISAWHIDLEHPLTKKLSIFGRWEYLSMNNNINLIDVQKKITLGLAFHHKQSIFSIFYETPYVITKFYQPQLVFLYQLLLRKVDDKLPSL